jgi:hypothetical protein
MLIGPAIGEFDYKDLKSAIEGFRVLELQPNDFLWNVYSALDELSKVTFLSVHSVSKDIDLSSYDQEFRERSITATIKSMDMAHLVNADSLVLHPVNDMYLNPVERLEHADVFLESFEKIMNHYNLSGHNYKLCIENIEYPKYPATLEETLDLQKKIPTTGIVIDIPHIWHSRDILRENPDYYREHSLGFPNGETLYQNLSQFIQENEHLIEEFHIAGFGHNPLRTHAPLYERKNPIYNQLFTELIKKPIIMEIYGQSKEQILLNEEIFRGLK